MNWGGGDVNINVNRYNNINNNRQINNSKLPAQRGQNRRGVPYATAAVSSSLARTCRAGRATARLPRSRRTTPAGTGGPAAARHGPGAGRDQLRNDPAARQRADAAARGQGGFGGNDGLSPVGARGGPGGDNAFSGAGNAGQARQQMDRGNASRQMAHPSAGREAAMGVAATAGAGAAVAIAEVTAEAAAAPAAERAEAAAEVVDADRPSVASTPCICPYAHPLPARRRATCRCVPARPGPAGAQHSRRSQRRGGRCRPSMMR